MDYGKAIHVDFHSSITWAGEFSYSYKGNKNKLFLNEAIENFTEHLKQSCAQNTIYSYSRDLLCLQNKIGNIQLCYLTEEALNGFLSQFYTNNIKNHCLSDATLNRMKSSYRSFFYWCFTKKYIAIDLSKEIRLVKTSSHQTPAISQQEISVLLDTISKSSDRYSQRDKVLFAVLAFTGIRKSEALALRISDYDTQSKKINLQQSKRSSKTYQLIPSILAETLNSYINENLSGEIITQSLPLFPSNQTSSFLSCRQACLSGRQASNIFEKWKTISGIRKNLTIHSFRAAYASQLYQKTMNPLLVSYALGHASFNTTKRYINEDIFDLRLVLENAFPAI